MSADRFLFFRQFLRSFQTTGAIAPSGSALAQTLVSPLKEIPSPRRILEAGPGTGVFSDRIVRLLEPGDEYILCEINPAFAQHLERKLVKSPEWSAIKDSIRVERGDVRDLFSPQSFDFIVSGLPLNNFPAALVDELLEGFLQSLKPGGIYAFFEYQAIRKVRMRVSGRETASRMEEIDRRIDRLIQDHTTTRIRVFRNVPPASAFFVKAGKEKEE